MWLFFMIQRHSDDYKYRLFHVLHSLHAIRFCTASNKIHADTKQWANIVMHMTTFVFDCDLAIA